MLNPANASFAEKLEGAGVSIRPATPAYLEELRGKFVGSSEFVALPETTENVGRVVRLCGAERVGIVPFGGGTGLVGGQVAPEGPAPLVVSLERLKAIRELRAEENTLITDAGVTLTQLHEAAKQADRLFPLSYASQDTAQIGSALSVNSGGLNVLRYGTARDLCLGIEAVLPNGEILHGLKRLRKDNTGYDLRNLLIGAEGTLGIITAAALKLFPRPAHRATAFIEVPSPTAALHLLSLFQRRGGETLTAFELISGQSFAFLEETHPDTRLPFTTAPGWAVLVEISTGPAVDADLFLAETYEAAAARDLVGDARLAQGGQQSAAFWAVRETIPEANRRIGAIASHDIALPLGEIAGFLKAAEPALSKLFPMRINAFGHLGDGNLHYNVFPPKGETKGDYMNRADEATRIVHDLVMERGGSFSAEHGVGRAKIGDLQRYGDPAKLAAMQAIKSALDPLGIMNPGAVLSDR
ncbi:MAG: FAD-binding oxidoreductase [Pseudomonadota bacterium]